MRNIERTPEEIFRYKFHSQLENPGNFAYLLTDSFFRLGIACLNGTRQLKQVYFPMKQEPLDLKDCFSLLEIIRKNENYLVRNRTAKISRGEIVREDQLNFHLYRKIRHYTTFSVEESQLDYPFENICPDGFSVLNYCYEASSGGGKVSSVAIIADPARNLPKAYEEGLFLYNYLKELAAYLKITFISSELSPADFDRILADSTLVHFCGHIEQKGIQLGKEYYSPAHSFNRIAPFIYLNGCALPPGILEKFIHRNIGNLIYSIRRKKDEETDLNLLSKFYLGLLLGYRIGDVARKTLDFSSMRLYGWQTSRFFLS